MRNYKISVLERCLFVALPLALLLSVSQVSYAADLAEIIEDVRGRALFIDEYRFTDTLLKGYINDEQEDIAIKSESIERDTTYAISITAFSYALPSDYYNKKAAILNKNPDNEENARPKAIDYVPIENYNKSGSQAGGRPSQWSITTDSFYINRTSATGYDSVTLKYAAHATNMLDGDSLMTLKDEFKNLLVSQVVLRCYNRVSYLFPNQTSPLMEALKQDIKELELRLYGRPADE